MNKILILVISCAIYYSIGCKQENSTDNSTAHEPYKPKGGAGDLVYNPVKPDGSIDSSYLPILTWKEEVHDFGTINEGDVVTYEYYFTNTGTAPLLINDAKSTCGCTIPEWPKTPIPPDSTASILVKFNSLHKTGAQSKEVTIFANTFPNQSKITIKGRVDKIN